MLPKLISRQFSDVSMASDTAGGSRDESGDGDVSMESASCKHIFLSDSPKHRTDTPSSVALLDDLPPLERARRRKSMMFPT